MTATATAPTLPTSLPLGHLRAFRADLLAVFLDAWRTCGDVARLRVGPRHLFLLSSPHHAQRLLVDNSDNYPKGTRGYLMLKRLLGDGLLTSEGETWKKHRRIANPAFRRKAIAGFGDVMAAAADDLASELLACGEPVDIAEAMGKLTLRVAGECFFSQDISAETSTIGRALSVVLDNFGRIVAAPLDGWDRLPTPTSRRYQQGARTLDRAARDIVTERRASGEERADLLGLLLAARDPDSGEGLSDEALRDEVLTMLLAGHETTASTLAWSLILLSQHPAVARTLRAEVAANTTPGQPVTAQQAMALTYTGQVISESMRLYPPAWIISRRASADDTIDGHPIPAGSFVFTCPYILHRHPGHWDNPEGFDPERFAPGAPARHSHAFLPFGGGRRKCIGSHFALLEARIVLASLLRRLDLSLLPGARIQPHASVTLRPTGDTAMSVKPLH